MLTIFNIYILKNKLKKTLINFLKKDIIAINGDIIGDISKYARGKNLDTLNPLLVDLNHLIKLCRLAIKEIELLSRKRVILYDVVFNTLLGDNLYIVDTKDYSWSLESYEET